MGDQFIYFLNQLDFTFRKYIAVDEKNVEHDVAIIIESADVKKMNKHLKDTHDSIHDLINQISDMKSYRVTGEIRSIKITNTEDTNKNEDIQIAFEIME